MAFKKRYGEDMTFIEHPIRHRKQLTPEQLKRGDITNKKAVRIDSRTVIMVDMDTDSVEAVERFHKYQQQCEFFFKRNMKSGK